MVRAGWNRGEQHGHHPRHLSQTSQGRSYPSGKSTHARHCPIGVPQRQREKCKSEGVGPADVFRRPDDIKVFMALGDSITAGFLARSSDEWMATHASTRDRQNYWPLIHRLFRWTPLLGWNVRLDKLIAWTWNGLRQQDAKLDVQTVWREWRGLSYPIGGDKGAITLPNILARWTNTTGQSYTPSLIPPIFRTHDEDAPALWGKDDGLNGAVSGSTSSSLLAQVQSRPAHCCSSRPS